MRKIISTDKAPKPIGPFSQGVQVGEFIFPAGQVALDSETGQLVGDTIEAQTHQALRNLKAVLQAAGSDLADVVKVTVYLTSMADMLYEQCMPSTFGTTRLHEALCRSRRCR
jgi:2-iminobutanoate/2-iminopropanoate deaminase